MFLHLWRHENQWDLLRRSNMKATLQIISSSLFSSCFVLACFAGLEITPKPSGRTSVPVGLNEPRAIPPFGFDGERFDNDLFERRCFIDIPGRCDRDRDDITHETVRFNVRILWEQKCSFSTGWETQDLFDILFCLYVILPVLLKFQCSYRRHILYLQFQQLQRQLLLEINLFQSTYVLYVSINLGFAI